MKTILVATDFSNTAANAAVYAADMAMAIKANVLLLHVYQLPVAYSEIPVAEDDASIIREAEKEITKLKERLVERSKSTLSIATEVRMGYFYPELERSCEQIKPYAVVLGSQGTSAVERFLLGSHAAHAIKHLPWPVITLPITASFTKIRKIGLACDFEDVVDNFPLDEIKQLVNEFHAVLHVLNTGRNDKFSPEVVFESALIEEMLKDVKHSYHFLTHKDADKSIMEFAETHGIDLLIVLPKRHGLIDKLLHQSFTKKLVLHTHVPVMSLH